MRLILLSMVFVLAPALAQSPERDEARRLHEEDEAHRKREMERPRSPEEMRREEELMARLNKERCDHMAQQLRAQGVSEKSFKQRAAQLDEIAAQMRRLGCPE